MIFPRDKTNTIPLEYSRVKCYNGISVRLQMNSITIIYQKYLCAIAGNYISSNIVKKYQHLFQYDAASDCPHRPSDYRDWSPIPTPDVGVLEVHVGPERVCP